MTEIDVKTCFFGQTIFLWQKIYYLRKILSPLWLYKSGVLKLLVLWIP